MTGEFKYKQYAKALSIAALIFALLANITCFADYKNYLGSTGKYYDLAFKTPTLCISKL